MDRILRCSLCLWMLVNVNLLWAQQVLWTGQTGEQSGAFLPGFTYQYVKRSLPDQAEVDARFRGEIQQAAIPIFLSYRISREVDLYITQTTAFSTTTVDSEDKSLNGLGDTQIQVSYTAADSSFLLKGGLRLPTGQRISGNDEREVSRALFADSTLVDFSLMRYHQGIDVDLGFVGAWEAGPFAIAAGGGYVHKPRYDTWVSDAIASWDAQDEIGFTSRINLSKRRFSWQSGATYTKFFSASNDASILADRGLSTELTEEFLVENRMTYEVPRFPLRFTEIPLVFEWDALASLTTARAAYDWPKTILVSRFGGYYTRRIQPIIASGIDSKANLTVRMGVEARHIPDEDSMVADAWLYSLDFGLQAPVYHHIQLALGFRYSTGHEYVRDKQNVELYPKVDLNGFGLSFRVVNTFDFGRFGVY